LLAAAGERGPRLREAAQLEREIVRPKTNFLQRVPLVGKEGEPAALVETHLGERGHAEMGRLPGVEQVQGAEETQLLRLPAVAREAGDQRQIESVVGRGALEDLSLLVE